MWAPITLWSLAGPFLILYLAATGWAFFSDPDRLRSERYLLETRRMDLEFGDPHRTAEMPAATPSPLALLTPPDDDERPERPAG